MGRVASNFGDHGDQVYLVTSNFCSWLSFFAGHCGKHGWLGSRVVSVLDSGVKRPGFKSQSRRCRVTVLGKLFTPIVFTKRQNW